MWLVRAPNSHTWVPVFLAGADDARACLREWLHADGRCAAAGASGPGSGTAPRLEAAPGARLLPSRPRPGRPRAPDWPSHTSPLDRRTPAAASAPTASPAGCGSWSTCSAATSTSACGEPPPPAPLPLGLATGPGGRSRLSAARLATHAPAPPCRPRCPRSFRPLKPQYPDAASDAAAKTRLYDFPLNADLGGGGLCRAVELPSGRLVCEYPVVNAAMADLYCLLLPRL
jgi:hypothetical protein